MEDGGGDQGFLDRFGNGLQTGVTLRECVCKRPLAESGSKQVRKQLGAVGEGQELVVAQVDSKRLEAWSVLDRLGGFFGEGGGGRHTTLAAVGLRHMFGHHQSNGRQIHHLTTLLSHHLGAFQGSATSLAADGEVGNALVGCVGKGEGRAGMTFLSALFASYFRPQGAGCRFLAQAIA